MSKKEYFKKLQAQDISTREQFWNAAFSRNFGLLTELELTQLSEAKVAIPGMGGVGGAHLITLVRSGVGNFAIADFDRFAVENSNRQYGARVPNYGVSKLDAMAEDAYAINPYVNLELFHEGVTETNLDTFLEGVDVVVDGFDFFAISIRRKLFARAHELGIYVITAGPIGFGASMLLFSPHDGMSFDRYFDFSDDDEPADQYVRFAIGLTPPTDYLQYVDVSKINIFEKYGPSLGIACQLCSAVASTEALRILLHREEVKPAPYYYRFDPYLQRYHRRKLIGGNKNPLQKLRFSLTKRAFSGGVQTNALDFPRLPLGERTGETPSDDAIRFIAGMGVWAPSGDNSQHWKFRWDGTQLYLDDDSERSDFAYSATGEPVGIAHGAALENCMLAAAQLGFSSSLSLNPNFPDEPRVAQLSFEASDTPAENIARCLTARHTNRKLYAKTPIPPRVVQRLQETNEEFSEFSLRWVNSKEEMQFCQRLAKTTDTLIWSNESLHRDLCKWLRADYREQKDGLSYGSLQFDFAKKLGAPLLRNWKFLEFGNTFGLAKLPVQHSQSWMKHSAAYCILSAPGRSIEDFIQGGRFIQRFWLRATAAGLSLQPMSSLVMFFNHVATDKTAIFSAAQTQKLEQAYAAFTEQFPEVEVPLFFFRLGYATPMKERSPRRSLDEMLTFV